METASPNRRHLVGLYDSSRPLGPAQITKALHKRGREDPRDHVAAALAYLKRKGRVEHVGPGKWTVEAAEGSQAPISIEGGDAS